jgi:hypothetical protein
MKKIDWKPVTLDECMKALSELLSVEDQTDLLRMSKKELGACHHGLGQWIRNNWDLWKGGPLLEHLKSLGFIHPDDMSMFIIEEWWARMNKLPSTMEADIKYYADYWKKMEKERA